MITLQVLVTPAVLPTARSLLLRLFYQFFCQEIIIIHVIPVPSLRGTICVLVGLSLINQCAPHCSINSSGLALAEPSSATFLCRTCSRTGSSKKRQLMLWVCSVFSLHKSRIQYYNFLLIWDRHFVMQLKCNQTTVLQY